MSPDENKPASSDNTNIGQIFRQIKHLQLKPADHKTFVAALNLLTAIAGTSAKDRLPQKTTPFESTLSTTKNKPIKELAPCLFSAQEFGIANYEQDHPPNSIEHAYSAISANFENQHQFLLPADVLMFAYDVVDAYIKFNQNLLRRPQLEDTYAKLQEVHQSLAQQFLQRWQGEQINQAQEISLANSVFQNKQINDVLFNVIDTILSAYKVIQSLDAEEPEAETEPDEAEVADEQEAQTLADAKEADKSAEAEAPRPTEPKTDQAEDSPPSFEKFGHQLNLFTASFTYTSINSILAAYGLNSSGQALASLSNLSPDLRQTLVDQFQPHIKKILLSLDDQEINSLIQSGASASAVRLKILQQAHRLAVNNPVLKLLIQQVFNEHLTEEAEEEILSKEKQEQLADQLNQTSHSRAFNNLGPISRQDDHFEKKQQQQLQTIGNHSRLTAKNYRQKFGQELQNIIDEEIDPSKIQLARSNLESTLTGLTVANPLMGEFFINSIGYAKFSIFLGDLVSREQFKQKEQQLKFLLKQYWSQYRSQLDNQYPELEQLSQMSSPQKEIGPEKADELLQEVGTVREQITQIGDLSTQDDTQPIAGRKLLDAWAGKEPDLQPATREEAELYKKIKQQKQHFWERIPQIEQQLYQQLVAQTDQRREKHNYFILNQAAALNRHAQAAAQMQLSEQLSGLRQVLRLKVAQEKMAAYAQNLALLTHNNFLTPQQPLPMEALPAGVQESIAQSGMAANYQPPQTSQAAQNAKKLAVKGIDAGLNYLTGGALQAIPKPIREAIIAKGIEQGLKKLKRRAKIIAGVSALAALTLIAALKKLSAFLSQVVNLGLIGTGGLVGFLIGGPVGGLVGAGIGGSLALLRDAPQQIRPALASAAESIGEVTSGFWDLVKEKAGLSSEAGIAQRLGLAGEAGAATGAAATSAVNPFTLSVAGAATVPIAAAAVTTYLISSAFLLDIDPSYIREYEESLYANVSKQAQIIDPPECGGGVNCLDPNFPIEVEYTVTISPKDDNIITINEIYDETSVQYNHEAYHEEGREAPSGQEITKSAQDINADDLIGEELNAPASFAFTQEYNDGYNHSLIRNSAVVEFEYQAPDGSGLDSARGSASVTIGDPPKTTVCWPVSGKINQPPYYTGSEYATHQNVDAYDVVPRDEISTDQSIYAPMDGELCSGLWGKPGYGLWDNTYGYAVSIRANVKEEEYILVFAHMPPGEARVEEGSCRPVSQGEIIGVMGNTGFSRGKHLHLEKRGVGSMSLTELMTNGAQTEYLKIGEVVHSCAEQ